MRIAFISLYDLENNAVRQLAHYLRQQGHPALEVYFKDWKNNGLVWPSHAELRNLARGLRRFGAEVIGLSLRASAYLEVCSYIIDTLREELGVPILLGGVHVSLCPESSAKIADYVVRGEAELPVTRLLDDLESGGDGRNVPNIWANIDGTVHPNEIGDLEENLDLTSTRDFAHPDKLVVDGTMTSSRDPMLDDSIYLIMASRGCMFHCSFCYNSTLRKLFKGKGKYYRYRSVGHVIDELVAARRQFKRMRRVRFDDEIFPPDQAWIDEFVERYPREVGLPFECFLEPRVVNEQRLQGLVDAGLDVVYMGVQANDRVSKQLYDRRASNNGILDTARLYHKLGIDARFQVMIDDPFTTEQDNRDLFDMLNSFPRPFRVYLFSMTVMPGTELETKLLDQGLITPDEVEGAATKTFYQYRVSLDWDRPPEQLFWAAMFVLVNKPGLSPKMLERMADSVYLRAHPRVVAQLASVSNVASMAAMVPASAYRGEIGVRVLRRFWTPGHWITA